MSKKYELSYDKKQILADNERFAYRNDFGRQSEHILCPFCHQKTLAYTWSLCGSGKKCEHCPNTLHSAYSSAMRFKTEAAAEKKLKELENEINR